MNLANLLLGAGAGNIVSTGRIGQAQARASGFPFSLWRTLAVGSSDKSDSMADFSDKTKKQMRESFEEDMQSYGENYATRSEDDGFGQILHENTDPDDGEELTKTKVTLQQSVSRPDRASESSPVEGRDVKNQDDLSDVSRQTSQK